MKEFSKLIPNQNYCILIIMKKMREHNSYKSINLKEAYLKLKLNKTYHQKKIKILKYNNNNLILKI